MGRIEELEHTADVGFRVEAATPAELFELAAAGLVRSLGLEAPSGEGEPGDQGEVLELVRPDRERLLVAWLRELLGRAAAEVAVPEVEVERISLTDEEPSLRARVRWRPAAGGPDREIKGVTYHGLRVAPGDGGWHASVVLDV